MVRVATRFNSAVVPRCRAFYSNVDDAVQVAIDELVNEPLDTPNDADKVEAGKWFVSQDWWRASDGRV